MGGIFVAPCILLKDLLFSSNERFLFVKEFEIFVSQKFTIWADIQANKQTNKQSLIF